ncbi:YqjD family protein [Methylocella sp.]|uniref:DUF883 family protein n=1 Tax=Methylocella sp. TaxID=1978226 RepID=UPI0035AE2690
MIDTRPLEEASKDFAADLAALREDIAKLTASVSQIIKNEAAAKSETVYGVMDNAKQKLSDGASDAKGKLSDASAELEASIERNPLMAVLIALATGLVIGLISRGK